MEFEQNCTHCVVTVEHQLNGTWVQASPRPVLDESLGDLLDALPPAHGYAYPDYDGLIDQMARVGVGARGFVYISRSDGSAHVFNVITTRDGVAFLDGQSGTLAKLETDVT